ncbi:MAG: peptidase [Alphaproteobacteria bacterium PA4]|nr:MAG: peptidase [Alphaproteobacteria bacterium PA4]
MVAAAADSNARECCGLLLGTTGHIATAVPAANVAATPERAFEIDPATLLRVHRDARGAGQKVIGHYHSHPNGKPEPSPRDAARAIENGQIWLIIADGGISGWQAVSADSDSNALHGRFRPLTLAVQ